MTVMGFDPLTEKGKAPFARCDSTLAFGEQLGVGIRDLKKNEILGVNPADVVFSFAAIREKMGPPGRRAQGRSVTFTSQAGRPPAPCGLPAPPKRTRRSPGTLSCGP